MSGAAAQFTDAQIQEFKVSQCLWPFPLFPFFFLFFPLARFLSSCDASAVFGGMWTKLWVAGGLQAVRQG